MSLSRLILNEEINSLTGFMKGIGLDIGGERAHAISGIERPNLKWIFLNINERYQPNVVGSAEALPLNAASVDTVLMLELLEHLQDPERALDEAQRVLKPNGRLFLSVPFLYRHHRNPFDYQRWTHEKLFEEIEVRRKIRIEVFVPRGAWLAVLFDILTLGLCNIRPGTFFGSALASKLGFHFSRVIIAAYPWWKKLDDHLANEKKSRSFYHRFTLGYVVVARKLPDGEELAQRPCPDVLRFPCRQLS